MELFNNSNPDNNCILDCFGDAGGSAILDDCNICDGNNQSQDCDGVCNGDHIIDECGECEESNNACIIDCNGEAGGSAEMVKYYKDMDNKKFHFNSNDKIYKEIVLKSLIYKKFHEFRVFDSFNWVWNGRYSRESNSKIFSKN